MLNVTHSSFCWLFERFPLFKISFLIFLSMIMKKYIISVKLELRFVGALRFSDAPSPQSLSRKPRVHPGRRKCAPPSTRSPARRPPGRSASPSLSSTVSTLPNRFARLWWMWLRRRNALLWPTFSARQLGLSSAAL